MRILRWSDETSLLAQLGEDELSHSYVIAHSVIPVSGRFGRVSVIPHDAEAFARALYGELHRCDDAGADLIIVEAPPDGPEWAGIVDRLKRGAAG